jgi:hypothetical protein
LHRLVGDLNKLLNRPMAECAEAAVGWRPIFGFASENRSAVERFMCGLSGTPGPANIAGAGSVPVLQSPVLEIQRAAVQKDAAHSGVLSARN